MCVDPVSLTTIGSTIAGAVSSVGSALGGASTLFGVGSGLLGAYATYQNGRAQASALEQQAADQERSARQRLEQGREESDRRRRAGAIQLGNQRAALAANGVDVEGELAIDLLDDSSQVIDEDAFSIRENSRRDATSLSQQSANSLTQAANARSEGTFGAISTVLTTGAKVGSKFSRYAQPPRQTDSWRGLRTARAY